MVRPLVVLSSLAMGGAERVTVSFLVRLAERGVPVRSCTVTSRSEGALVRELARAGVSRCDLRARRLADPLALWRLTRLLSREGIGIVHAHGQDASILSGLACTVARTRLVVTRHVLAEPTVTRRQRLRAKLALASIAKADAVVAVSQACAEALSVLVPKVRGRIHVIPNGIELGRHLRGLDADGRLGVRRQIGVPPSAPLLLLPAALREGKGHDLLLRSLPRLLRSQPETRVAFAGAGELEGPLRMHAAPFGERVMFLGQRDDVAELLAASDLVVLPSASEALPTVLMEAAAAGRPVVASRVGGVPEVVDHGRIGLLVPPGDEEAFAAAVVKVLGDPELARRLGDRGRRTAVERFALDRMAERTLELWLEVIRQDGR